MPAKSQPILNRLAGKRVVFQGKFGWGEVASLKSLVEAHLGFTLQSLDASIDFLVLADLAQNRTVQKQAQSLNAKGASVQVVDADMFRKQFAPTQAELIEMIRGGKGHANVFFNAVGPPTHGLGSSRLMPATVTFSGDNFDGADVSGFVFTNVLFERCSFVGAVLDKTHFGDAIDCDFSRARGVETQFNRIHLNRFTDARLVKPRITSHFAGSDFTGAMLEAAVLTDSFWASRVSKPPSTNGAVFARATLRSCQIAIHDLNDANFDGADVTGSVFRWNKMNRASFRKATVKNAWLTGCDLVKADLSGADFTGANLGEADLTDAKIDDANFAGANLRGAKLKGATVARARNLDPAHTTTAAPSAIFTELDNVADAAREIRFSFSLEAGADVKDTEFRIHVYGGRKSTNSAHPYIVSATGVIEARPLGLIPLSKALLQSASVIGHQRIRYETLEVKSTKSPKGGKELKQLITAALAEAFMQPVPTAEELAKLTKGHRGTQQKATSAAKAQRAAAKAAMEKEKEKAKKQIAKQIAKKVGKVTDLATFLKALELRIEKPKIDKATKMLRASGFKLYNDIAETYLTGVVKSQTDADLVYACRIAGDGEYACCTQNLNVCGGLRGSICKHLLVLIIGLVQAGELDAATIDAWIARTHDAKPELDKEVMGEIFIRYKGAEAGEVDWRPTQTVPEDYYAV